MKKPASFHTVTTIRQPSAVFLLPSQLWLPKPSAPSHFSSSPYSGVKKKSQMFATAIIGRMVGVKYARRRKPRPAMRLFTHTAISMASAMESGMVPAA